VVCEGSGSRGSVRLSAGGGSWSAEEVVDWYRRG